MKKILILIPFLMFTACSPSVADVESDVCQSAVDRLPDYPKEFSDCLESVAKARSAAWEQAAQPFRNKPRVTP
jgi:hypothetical protein